MLRVREFQFWRNGEQDYVAIYALGRIDGIDNVRPPHVVFSLHVNRRFRYRTFTAQHILQCLRGYGFSVYKENRPPLDILSDCNRD